MQMAGYKQVVPRSKSVIFFLQILYDVTFTAWTYTTMIDDICRVNLLQDFPNKD
jgi:hypothetical protein